MSPEREVHTLDDLRRWAAVGGARQVRRRLAVLGDPIAHSASPPMQNAALAACGIDAHYTRLHVPPAGLAEAFSLLAPAGFIGVNLTLPHKTAALPLLDALDPHAARLGAVNTVRLEPDESLRGFNTDGPGFSRAVQSEFGLSLEGATVLIVGAGGGAGRALATQCAAEGCARLFLVNRTFEKACCLADELGTQTIPVQWEPAALREMLGEVDLIVNTSSLGLKPDDPSPLAAELIPARARVFDTVYRAGSAPTPLLAAALAAGARAIGGHALLLHQGALAFEHWFGEDAPLETMRAALLSA